MTEIPVCKPQTRGDGSGCHQVITQTKLPDTSSSTRLCFSCRAPLMDCHKKALASCAYMNKPRVHGAPGFWDVLFLLQTGWSMGNTPSGLLGLAALLCHTRVGNLQLSGRFSELDVLLLVWSCRSVRALKMLSQKP